jgi:hypothetical protein
MPSLNGLANVGACVGGPRIAERDVLRVSIRFSSKEIQAAPGERLFDFMRRELTAEILAGSRGIKVLGIRSEGL